MKKIQKNEAEKEALLRAHQLKQHAIALAAKAAGVDYGVVRASGKAPVDHRGRFMKGWEKVALDRPSADEVRAWNPDVMTGWGIVLGSPTGDGFKLVAIDIDIDDHDQIMELRSALPYTLMMKRGKKGCTLFFKVKDGDLLKSRVYRGLVDYLGAGRQTVMPGSIHPETGKPYEWYDGGKLMPPAKLPELTEEHMEQFEEALAATCGWDRKYQNTSARGNMAVVHSEYGRNEEYSYAWINRLALDNISDWVEDLDLYNGKWRGARYTAVNTLRSSSTGRDLKKRKRNLSIHPDGIRDFGSGESYSPIDLVMGIKGMEGEAAYNWLFTHLVPATQVDLSAALAKAEARQKERGKGEPKPKPKVRREMGPLPEKAFDAAPGFIGRLAREIRAGSPYMPKTLALMTAISTLSAITARRYLGETFEGTLQLTTYTVAMSQTGGGKDHAINFGARLLHAMKQNASSEAMIYAYDGPYDRLKMKQEMRCDMRPSEGVERCVYDLINSPQDITSDAALANMLWSSGVAWMRVDEFGSVFANWSKPRNNTTPLTSYFRKFYSKSAPFVMKQYAANSSVGTELRTLRETPLVAPSITLLGVSTPEQMYNAFDDNMAEDGTINRFIIAHEDAPKMTEEQTYELLFGKRGGSEIDPEIVAEAQEIFLFGHKSGDIGGLGIYMNEIDRRFDVFQDPKYIVVKTADEEARRAMTGYYYFVKMEQQEADDESTKYALARIGENFCRLACLAAIADNSERSEGVMPAVRLEHVEWAKLVMETVRVNLTSLVTDHIGSKEDKEKLGSRKRIRRSYSKHVEKYKAGQSKPGHVHKGGWVHTSYLRQSSHDKFRSMDHQELKALITEGEFEEKSLNLHTGEECSNGAKYVRLIANMENE